MRKATPADGDAQVRVRFAPSPTGPLHVGSVRTALFNWLFARGHGGEFLLRIDDTDRDRSDADMEARIKDELAATLGLDWDRTYRQSDRRERYAEVLHSHFEPDPDGAYSFGDRRIARSDGSVLYNLATAIDDVDDGITHVLRGRDHLPNTELQIALIERIGGTPPVYAHAPLMVMADGGKLSKRGDDTDMTLAGLVEQGYAPLAICNALALSLADYGEQELMFSLTEIARRFELERLHSADAQFDLDKLAWISGQHIRAMTDDDFAGALARFTDLPVDGAALAAARDGGSTFVECAFTAQLLLDPPEPDDDARQRAASDEAAAGASILLGIAPDPPADAEAAAAAFAALKAELKQRGVKLGPALKGVRARLTGRTDGPELTLVFASATAERWRSLAG